MIIKNFIFLVWTERLRQMTFPWLYLTCSSETWLWFRIKTNFQTFCFCRLVQTRDQSFSWLFPHFYRPHTHQYSMSVASSRHRDEVDLKLNPLVVCFTGLLCPTSMYILQVFFSALVFVCLHTSLLIAAACLTTQTWSTVCLKSGIFTYHLTGQRKCPQAQGRSSVLWSLPCLFCRSVSEWRESLVL